jgi:hypothetical protein
MMHVEEERVFKSLGAFRETFLPKSKGGEAAVSSNVDPEATGCFMAENALKALAPTKKKGSK